MPRVTARDVSGGMIDLRQSGAVPPPRSITAKSDRRSSKQGMYKPHLPLQQFGGRGDPFFDRILYSCQKHE